MTIKKTIILLSFSLFSISVFSQWTIPMDNFFSNRMDDIYFVTPEKGWVAAGSTIFKTNDGGLSWANQFNQPGLYFRSIEFLDENRGFAGTLDSIFLRTLDGGQTWEDISLNITPRPPGICGISHVGDVIYASGIWNGPAFILKSLDGGDTWEYIDMSEEVMALVEVHFDDADTGFATGQDENGGIILRTEDGGESWDKVYSSDETNTWEWAWKLQRVTEDTLVVSLERVFGPMGVMLASYDNGATWVTKDIPTGNPDYQGIGFINGNHGWVSGHGQTISETLDGGETWTYLDIGHEINRFFVYSENLVYASGATVYKYGEEEVPSSTSTLHQYKDIRPDFGVRQSENGHLKIHLELDYTDNVDLCLYTMDGRRVEQVFKGRLPSGMHFFESLNDLPSGAYVLGLQINRGVFSEKVVVN